MRFASSVRHRSDGTLGPIRENSGLTLAQAEYDSHALPGMPQSATASERVDEMLAVEGDACL
jgi:two-component system CheB/CheR fusion protein